MIVRSVKRKNHDRSELKRVHEYINNEEKCKNDHIYGGCFGKDVIKCFDMVNNFYYGKNCRTFVDYIFSFKKYLDQDLADDIFQSISDYVVELGFQNEIAVHHNTEHLHGHMIINTVNFKNWKKWSMSKKQLMEFKVQIDNILKNHGIDEQVLYEENMEGDEIESEVYKKEIFIKEPQIHKRYAGVRNHENELENPFCEEVMIVAESMKIQKTTQTTVEENSNQNSELIECIKFLNTQTKSLENSSQQIREKILPCCEINTVKFHDSEKLFQAIFSL